MDIDSYLKLLTLTIFTNGASYLKQINKFMVFMYAYFTNICQAAQECGYRNIVSVFKAYIPNTCMEIGNYKIHKSNSKRVFFFSFFFFSSKHK